VDDRIAGYASGVFELARAEGDLERVENELLSIAQAIEASTELRSTLTDPQLSLDRKQAIVDDLIGGRASTLTVGLVQLIVNQGRVAELPAIATAVAQSAAASRDKALGEVRSAVPLDEDTIARLETSLSRATGKSVEVKVIVDPSVIGGIVARVGDTVIDGSLARRVETVRQNVSS
jgi:F-type H+-transporting ATPase subunit delta